MSDATLPLSARPAGRSGARRVPIVVAGCIFVACVVVICAAMGPVLAPRDPDAQNLLIGLSPPSAEYWLGTDDLGRDVFSRVIVGARTAVVGSLLIAVGAMLISNALGLFAGYRGGWVDASIMRGVDFVYAVPALLVAIVVSGVLGGGYWLAVALLTVLFVPYDARIIRGLVLSQRSRPYVEAAQLLGLPKRTIMIRHIWPNLSSFVLANFFLDFAFALVTLSALSFLGLGAPPGTPDWGRMLAESTTLLFENPAAALAPAGLIILTAASANLIGDWCFELIQDRG